VGRIGYIVAEGIVIAAIIGLVVLFHPLGNTGGTPPIIDNNSTGVASEQPALELVLLEGAEDASKPVARYAAGNNETIYLQIGSHLRFESPQSRPPDSLRVVAHDLEDGSVLILRKSYDVNNEFFVNLQQGKYELRAETSWVDKEPYLYTYDITVSS